MTTMVAISGSPEQQPREVRGNSDWPLARWPDQPPNCSSVQSPASVGDIEQNPYIPGAIFGILSRLWVEV